MIEFPDFTTRISTPTTTTQEPIREIIVDGNRLFDFQVDSNFDLICQSFLNFTYVVQFTVFFIEFIFSRIQYI